MKLRGTLNGKQPRTLRDAQRDPYDWIEHHRSPSHSVVLAFRVWLALVGFLAASAWLAVAGK